MSSFEEIKIDDDFTLLRFFQNDSERRKLLKKQVGSVNLVPF
jgi:hypothetical protein